MQRGFLREEGFRVQQDFVQVEFNKVCVVVKTKLNQTRTYWSSKSINRAIGSLVKIVHLYREKIKTLFKKFERVLILTWGMLRVKWEAVRSYLIFLFTILILWVGVVRQVVELEKH